MHKKHHQSGIDTVEPSINIIHGGDQSTSGDLDFIENKWNEEERNEWENAYEEKLYEDDEEYDDDDDDYDDYDDEIATESEKEERIKENEGETVVIGLSSDIRRGSGSSSSSLSKAIQDEIKEKLSLVQNDPKKKLKSRAQRAATSSSSLESSACQTSSPSTATFKLVNGKLTEDE